MASIFFSIVQAAEDTTGGLVSCQAAGECNFCALMTMINDIVSWVIIIGTLFAVVVLAYAGMLLIFSRGDTAALEKGKQTFINSIIGILIMLAGWMIVDTTIKLVTGGKLGMWNEVECGAGEFSVGEAKYYIALTAEEIEQIRGVDDEAVGAFEQDHGIVIGGGANCPGASADQVVGIPGEPGKYLLPSAASNYVRMRQAAANDGITLRITSAWRSQATQEAIWERHNCDVTGCRGTVARPCSKGGSGSNHNGGVAVDIAGSSRGSTIYNWLKANGGRFNFYNNLPNDPVHWSPTGR